MTPPSRGPTTVEVLRDRAALRAISGRWRELHADGDGSPFLSPDWLLPCAERRAPFVVVARRGARVVGVLPLALRSHGPIRRLGFLGEGRSDYEGALVATGEPRVEAALLEGLHASRGAWDVCELRQLHPDLSALHDAPLPQSLLRRVESGACTYHVREDLDWDALVQRGPNWLWRMKRKLRKFEGAGGTVERHVGPAASRHLGEALEVEMGSWKGPTGLLLRPGLYAFFAELFRTEAPVGAELWLARVGGRPVGYGLNLFTTRWVGLYQGAFTEEHRAVGPGSVLEWVAIRDAWRRGCREYDYMTGDGPYKRERTDRIRHLVDLTLWVRTARGRMAAAAYLRGREWLARRRASSLRPQGEQPVGELTG